MRCLLAPLLLLPVPVLGGCGGSATAKAEAPVTSEAIAEETELVRLTLSRDAQRRLGIATEAVGDGSAAATRMTSGEIIVPAGIGGAPITSASDLQLLAAQQVAADGEVLRARAQLRLAQIAHDRAAALVDEEAGSIRALDEATAALAAAKATAQAASAQRQLLGPTVARQGDQRVLWVRVPVFGTDVASIHNGAAVSIAPLGQERAGRPARPVEAPPSANAVAGTVDLFFAFDNRDRAFRVGQRVAVTLPLAGGTRQGLAVPTSALLNDIYGGEWVYAKTGPDTFVRQRVEVAAIEGDRAILARGLQPGMAVVTAGAAELFGTEFGVAH